MATVPAADAAPAAAYQALARTYRPQTFEQVVGQEHVLAALRNSLDANRLHHAYLLTGTRGVGKTTIARILARSLQCQRGISSSPCGQCDACRAITAGSFPDVVEIDAASESRVEETRALLENTQYPPLYGRCKVYIIDEVHMLSAASFNALLKTLEAPPDYVKFILATTEVQKIPTTVLSRCLKFQLRALTTDEIASRITAITAAEHLACPGEAAQLLARAARGSMRDALSLCDQAVALGAGEIRTEQVLQMLGTASDELLERILRLLQGDPHADPAALLNDIAALAPNYRNLIDSLAVAFHDLSLFQIFGGSSLEVFTLPQALLRRHAPHFTPGALQDFYAITLSGSRDYVNAPDGRIAFEMTYLRLLLHARELQEGAAAVESARRMPHPVPAAGTGLPPAAAAPEDAPQARPAAAPAAAAVQAPARQGQPPAAAAVQPPAAAAERRAAPDFDPDDATPDYVDLARTAELPGETPGQLREEPLPERTPAPGLQPAAQPAAPPEPRRGTAAAGAAAGSRQAPDAALIAEVRAYLEFLISRRQAHERGGAPAPDRTGALQEERPPAALTALEPARPPSVPAPAAALQTAAAAAHMPQAAAPAAAPPPPPADTRHPAAGAGDVPAGEAGPYGAYAAPRSRARHDPDLELPPVPLPHEGPTPPSEAGAAGELVPDTAPADHAPQAAAPSLRPAARTLQAAEAAQRTPHAPQAAAGLPPPAPGPQAMAAGAYAAGGDFFDEEDEEYPEPGLPEPDEALPPTPLPPEGEAQIPASGAEAAGGGAQTGHAAGPQAPAPAWREAVRLTQELREAQSPRPDPVGEDMVKVVPLDFMEEVARRDDYYRLILEAGYRSGQRDYSALICSEIAFADDHSQQAVITLESSYAVLAHSEAWQRSVSERLSAAMSRQPFRGRQGPLHLSFKLIPIRPPNSPLAQAETIYLERVDEARHELMKLKGYKELMEVCDVDPERVRLDLLKPR